VLETAERSSTRRVAAARLTAQLRGPAARTRERAPCGIGLDDEHAAFCRHVAASGGQASSPRTSERSRARRRPLPDPLLDETCLASCCERRDVVCVGLLYLQRDDAPAVPIGGSRSDCKHGRGDRRCCRECAQRGAGRDGDDLHSVTGGEVRRIAAGFKRSAHGVQSRGDRRRSADSLIVSGTPATSGTASGRPTTLASSPASTSASPAPGVIATGGGHSEKDVACRECSVVTSTFSRLCRWNAVSARRAPRRGRGARQR